MAPKGGKKRKLTRDESPDEPVPSAISIEGLAAGHEHAGDMGIYTLIDEEVNAHRVWSIVGHREAFLFYSDMGSWCISDAEDMQGGTHQGSLMVESDAQTPDQITQMWSVHDSENWSDNAPSVSASKCASATRDKAVDCIEQEQIKSREAAQQAPVIVLEGVASGEEYEDSMGEYCLAGARHICMPSTFFVRKCEKFGDFTM